MLEIQEAMVTVKPCQRVYSLEWTDDETQLSQTAREGCELGVDG
jgi:hypothetical protein